jgi:MFS family permease
MEIGKNENVAAMDAHTKRSQVVKILTANDIIVWGSDAFISVALALFVVTYIEGATILNVGIGLMIHRVVGALAAIPIGRWFDTHKGYLDEVRGLSFACLVSGFSYITLSFATEIWQFYLIMFFLGFSAMVNLASWRILFYNNIGKKQFGQTLGVYQMLFSLGIGLFLAVGGFAGDRYGYDTVLLFGGVMMTFGSLLPLLIEGYFEPKKK